MSSYASEMPSSPGVIPTDDLYKSPNPYHNSYYADQQQQLSSIQEENLRLKANLARVQNEYEELRDESNYQRAKVSELTELVKSSKSQSSSFPQSQNSAAATDEHVDTGVHKALIEKSLQNAELTLNFDKLKNELHHAEARLKNLELQKRANGKLLLEMGDVIRTLNSVDIEYDAFTPKGEKLSVQEQSIKNIKLKVEAMLKNRNALIQKCHQLSESAKAQKKKIRALEAQLQVANSVNSYEAISLQEVAIHKNDGSSLSITPSTLSDDMMSQESSIVSKKSAKRATDAAASEIVRQSRELAKYRKQEKEHAKEIANLKYSEKTHQDTISSLESANEKLSSKISSLKKSLRNTKGMLGDAVTKRDEFKGNLVDIISHYKELQGDHEHSNDKVSKLEELVAMLQSKVRETQEEQVKLEREMSERSNRTQESNDDSVKSDELLAAYSKAQRQIVELRDSLMKRELEESRYRESVSKCKQMEQERNEFQRKLDQALEENQKAKEQIKKEQEESKQVRRQLRTLLQHRDDETASLESENDDGRCNESSRSRSTRSRASSHKKALVKKAAFKPLTVEELMEKDFS